MGFMSDFFNPSGWDWDSNSGYGDKLGKSLLTGGASSIASLGNDWKRISRSGGGPSTMASDTMAALTRERWADYVKNFVPIENQLIDYATNPETVTNAMSSASENVQDAFGAREGMVSRQLRGLGLTLSEDEQIAANRSTGLAKSLADVQAQNLVRDATMSRQQQILGNPAPDVVRMNNATGN